MQFSNFQLVDHPLAQHFLTSLRDQDTPPGQFRTLCKRLTTLLAVAASRDLATETAAVQTPLEPFVGLCIRPIVAVAILRAGLGMLDPIVEMFPDVSVGYIGLERDETTAVASSYYAKLPPETSGKTVFLLDPMLATGGSASQACNVVKTYDPQRIVMLSIVSAPEGVARMLADHPEVTIFSSALDRELNNKKYILPGLGDFGDRLYGT